MAFNNYSSGEDSDSFKALVYRQIRKIQDISGKELRDNEQTLVTSIGVQTLGKEDTRFSFLQSIEMLGSLFYPYFGKSSAKKSFDDFLKIYDLELVEALDDYDFKKEVKELFGSVDEKNTMDINSFFLSKKLQAARKLFRELMVLFKDEAYFAGESYNESQSDDGITASDGDLTMPDDEVAEEK
jgi:hypothetical protein